MPTTSASLAPLVREAAASQQPGLPVADVQRVTEITAAGLLTVPHRRRRLGRRGLLALLLSATGVYATTLFWASTRTREFGLRMALGAIVQASSWPSRCAAACAPSPSPP